MQGALQALWSQSNSIGLAWRNLIRWRLPGIRNHQADRGALTALMADPGAGSQAILDWERSYGFSSLQLAPEPETARDALFVLGMVEAALTEAGLNFPRHLDAVDVGAKNWHYVRALWSLLAGYGGTRREVTLLGLEIDPFVVYRDGHSRYDWATFYSRGLGGASYQPGDFMSHQGRYDLVIVLFPILAAIEHLEFGLPLAHYHPQRLLAHAWDCVRKGGGLVVSCYDYEVEDFLRIARTLDTEPVVARPYRSPVASYEVGRFIAAWKRPGHDNLSFPQG